MSLYLLRNFPVLGFQQNTWVLTIAQRIRNEHRPSHLYVARNHQAENQKGRGHCWPVSTKGPSFLETLTHNPKMPGSVVVPSRTHEMDIAPTTSGHLYWSVRTAMKTLYQKTIFSQFWKLKIQAQDGSWEDSLSSFLSYRHLPQHRVLCLDNAQISLP